MEFRIGVNLGDVIEDRGDIYGDGVNVAARLEGLADPGGICISDAVRTAVGKKLDLAYEFMGEQAVKNIEEPVRAYRVLLTSEETLRAGSPEPPALELPDKPSIAVLPFTNMSGDPEQEYFSDGITEDIITELSRFPILFVIARHSSFAFKGEKVDIKNVGQKLGVQYVVEGSVRKAGNRVRITAQLIEAESGNHIWAERYDHQLEDIFDVQDEVTRMVVSRVSSQIDEERLTQSRRRGLESAQAYDLWLQGNLRYREYTGETTAEARKLYEQALVVDNQFARAYAGLAATYLTDIFIHSVRGIRNEVLAKTALCHAQSAIKLDDRDSEPHLALGWAYKFVGEYDRARKHFDRAVQLSPNHADTIAQRAWALAYLGEAELAIRDMQLATRLNPYPQDWYFFSLTTAYFVAERYEDALVTLDLITSGLSLEHVAWYAMLNAHLGRIDSARKFARRCIDQFHSVTEKDLDAGESDLLEQFVSRRRFRRQSDTERFVQGLARSGLRE